MSPRAAWGLAAALAAAACVVTAVTPRTHLVYSVAAVEMPFVVPMRMGEQAVGRTFAVTPEAVRVAEAVETDGGRLDGTWVVVDVVLDATGAEPGARLEQVELELGGATYTPSDRVDGTAEDATLRAGLPVRGSLVFEVPAGAAHGSARLTLGPSVDVRLDDQLVLDLDLDAPPAAVEVVEAWGWAS
ncbi:DUF4352 domain-containing protein [Microbacterium marinilacus]|uniref:DUF4352 domain-containing protein n=1 Tax=Microbacterium marinilacus TaxID=415209 RepID=A0ABP7BKQ5_9MICO|nr:DUF4352 domain-containing protein [Microbacterium marinilacus]MBY0689738.1 DUF4352 domain-containing protein [Microbacterium marinilacus]